MARRKQCQDLSNKRGQDTLMPVSPKYESVEKGLSRNGDTADGVGRGRGSRRRGRRRKSSVGQEVAQRPDSETEGRA